MKFALTIVQFALYLGIFCAVLATPAYPHGGGLDAYGCHINRKFSGYHCLRGYFAGQSFASKAEMLKKLSPEKIDKDTKIKTEY